MREQAKAWASKQAPVQKFRAMRDSGIEQRFDSQTWSDIIQMGWTGILISEEYGGSDLDYLTFGLVLEELGRHLTASPLFASALVGATALNIAGSDQQKEALLPKIVDGSEILTLAIDESNRHAPTEVALTAQATHTGFKLNGKKGFVLEGMAATTFIVTTRTSGEPGDTNGITMFLVSAGTSGLDREFISTADSRGYANLTFNDVEVSTGSVLGRVDDGWKALDAVLDRARAGLGAEMLGCAAQSFDMTLEYLKTREQFGEVIGSFQALGHRAAALFTGLELARSCAEAALQAIDEEVPNIAQMCSLSKSRLSDYLHEMSTQLIQIHGGIGMTDEFDAGFYLKRARALEVRYGNAGFHRDRYASTFGF
jgi:alkylation response protein AidB-like acyl-CoA dehydrogenase|tara:strand:+ start:2854 stop:3960 length:1107 start_codon:yes stop_codon:yes gene_type:complete